MAVPLIRRAPDTGLPGRGLPWFPPINAYYLGNYLYLGVKQFVIIPFLDFLQPLRL
jgi:hypothetical protein